MTPDFLEGWLTAFGGLIAGWVLGEITMWLRWRRERAKIQLNKDFGERIARQAIESWNREYHVDPPKDFPDRGKP